MRFFLFLSLFLFCFSVFSSEWVSNTYDVVKVPDSEAYSAGWNLVCTIPDYSELEVSTTGPYLRCFGSNDNEFGSSFSDSSGRYKGHTLCTWHWGGVGETAVVTVRYKPSNSDPDPDPDNPDPDNPDPDDPDPDDPDDSGGNWALESTLQNVKTLISDSNTLSKKISEDLRLQLSDVSDISSATSNIQSGVDSMKSDVNSMKGDVNSMKGDVKSIQSDVNSVKSDVKSIRSDVGRIKDVLSGGESPSSPSRLDKIDVTSSRWETLKKKLLPSYSFFDSMSGSSSYRFLFIFSFPYAHVGSSISATIDFPIANDATGSINLGSPVVSAYNNFIKLFRSVLLVLLAWCFLKVIIKTLRQW